MSLKATIEIILHLHSLTNIEIPNQGLFAIQIQLYQVKNGIKNCAIPYKIIDNVLKPSTKVRGKPDINDTIFRTRVGHIRYSDETIDLNDIIQFKLEVDAFPQLNDRQIYVEFTLLFSGRYYVEEGDIQNFKATPMESTKMRLQSIETGIISYYEGQFTQNYLSNYAFTLFAMITDYKFAGYRSPKQDPSSKELQRQRVQDFQQFIIWIKKNYQNCTQPIAYLFENYVKPLCSHSYNFRGLLNQVLKIKKQIKLKVSKNFLNLQQINEKIFFEYLTKYQPKNLSCHDLRIQLNQLHSDNFFYIQDIIQDFAKDRFNRKKMRQTYQNFMKEKFGQKMFKSITYGNPQITTKQHQQVVKSVRKKNIQLTQYPIVDVNLFQKNKLLGFYQVTYPQSYKKLTENQRIVNLEQPYDQRKMLIVLCHGFQGSSYDMMMINRGLKQALPMANYLISTSNETDTERDIEDMGSRLANQIRAYISKNLQEDSFILNFIGHSMGGIIARASLKHLTKYQKQLGFFCTLGSPHLGFLNGVDGMIKTGLWFINRWKKIVSLKQLTFDDSDYPKEAYLYRLSKQGTLRSFKKIILISSMEDNFAPWHSARICPHQSNNGEGKIERQMVQNMLGQIPVHRVDVNFNVQKNDLDGFIGRTAHINLIIQDNLFKLINWTIPKLFDIRDP